MFNAIRALSKFILFIAFLNIFAYSIHHVSIGGSRFGPLTKPLKSFAQFPKLVMGVFKELTLPSRLTKVDPSVETFNKLDYDLYGLNSHFSEKKWKIELKNFKDNSVIHSWSLDQSQYNKSGVIFSHAEPIAPLLYPKKNLILNNHETKYLYRLDAESKILWHNTDYQYHHSISQAPDGNVWACSRKLISLKNKSRYWDNHITKINAETGETMLHRSISEILIENDLEYLIHGFSNEVLDLGTDPLHHNEIEPVLEDGTYWKKGDLFLSFRHRSLILLYRPSTNKVIKLIHGPFINCHDVDITSDSTITVFNNNITSLANRTIEDSNFGPDDKVSDLKPDLNLYGGVVEYNFADSSYRDIFPKQFKEHNIYTPTQGLHEFISNGDLFVENTDGGLLYVFNENEMLLKSYANVVSNGGVEPVHWVRIYEEIDFSN